MTSWKAFAVAGPLTFFAIIMSTGLGITGGLGFLGSLFHFDSSRDTRAVIMTAHFLSDDIELCCNS